jgi:hypothetical protein
MPFICPCNNADGEGLDNETSVYKYSDYKVSANDAPHFYEYVDNFIRNLNQGIYDEHAVYNSHRIHTEPEYYGYDEDGYELYDMKHSNIDDAVSELTYKECDKFICEIGLRNAIQLYEDCGFGEITLEELKDLDGIRRFMYCIIYSCIDMNDDMKEVNKEEYKLYGFPNHFAPSTTRSGKVYKR